MAVTWKKIAYTGDPPTAHDFDTHTVAAGDQGKFIRVNPGSPVLEWRTAANVLADIGAVASASFNDHSARHEDGGADELNVTGCVGGLPDTSGASPGDILTLSGSLVPIWQAP